MFENVFEAINEKIERLKLDISLKDYEIERLKKELAMLDTENEVLSIENKELKDKVNAQDERGERF